MTNGEQAFLESALNNPELKDALKKVREAVADGIKHGLFGTRVKLSKKQIDLIPITQLISGFNITPYGDDALVAWDAYSLCEWQIMWDKVLHVHGESQIHNLEVEEALSADPLGLNTDVP